jgi:hypothetical protein
MLKLCLSEYVEVKGSNPSTASFLFSVLVLVMVSRNGISALDISCMHFVRTRGLCCYEVGCK